MSVELLLTFLAVACHIAIKGLKALWSPHTGIVDWGLVTRSYAEDFEKRGGTVFMKYSLKKLSIVGETATAGKANKYPVSIGSTGELVSSFLSLRCFGILLTIC